MTGYRVAILTVSDRASRGEAEDRSGPALEAVVRTLIPVTHMQRDLVPDEISAIRDALGRWSSNAPPMDLILTTGGTGLSPRDVTPEAALPLFDKPAPNLMELARLRCLQKTPSAYLSRGVAGVIGRSLVLTLPGSPRGAGETIEALGDILLHALDTVGDEGDRHHAPR
ncbi:MAG: MogA/MoaB family molybdenum cofactor biosynthesis protein [Phycisphaeraceae bacterium]|nr:MogA/MoaB family molybdenum cofactor biosynthesis protein [Phycisphaeraceae bacterium]